MVAPQLRQVDRRWCNLKGLHHLRSTCRSCGATIRTDPFHAGDILCHHCGTFNKNVVTFCIKCGDLVG